MLSTEEEQLEQSENSIDVASSTPQVDIETPRRAAKRPISSTMSTQQNVKKALHDPQISFMSGAIEKLENISSRAAQISKEDTYDHFGKYVASMLRTIGPPTAMRLQETITSLIVNAMCSPPTTSIQSADIISSGRESSMTDFSDDWRYTTL